MFSKIYCDITINKICNLPSKKLAKMWSTRSCHEHGKHDAGKCRTEKPLLLGIEINPLMHSTIQKQHLARISTLK